MAHFVSDDNHENGHFNLNSAVLQTFESPAKSSANEPKKCGNSSNSTKQNSIKQQSPIKADGGDVQRLDDDVPTPEVITTSGEDTNEAVRSIDEAEQEETEEQRKLREERESQELAWELMRQEQQEMYSLQMQYMQQNADDLTEEDRAVMEQLIGEVNQVDSMYAASRSFNRQMLSENGADPENGSEAEDLNDSDTSNWDYERLLSLGETLGDVKTERWRLRSTAVVESLPRLRFAEIVGTKRSNESVSPQNSEESTERKKVCVREDESKKFYNDCMGQDCRCIVCMDDFINEDMVLLLPCKHYFHQQCTEGWLKDHNSCPMCKCAVVKSP